MPTFNQISQRKIRTGKERKKSLLSGYPQKRGWCIKVYEVAPKKPNSAVRKIAKVGIKFTFYDRRNLLAYIPGFGPHGLQVLSMVLIRGGRVPDLPGVKYHIIRKKYDFIAPERFVRNNRRSKYSVKKVNFKNLAQVKGSKK